MKRLAAAIGVFIAGLFGLATVVLIGLAQVVPAIVTLVLMLTIGSFSFTTLRSPDSEEEVRTAEAADRPALASDLGEGTATALAPSRAAGFVQGIRWLLSALFAWAGIGQLFGVDFIVQRYALWHYPDQLRWAVGAIELVAAVALAFPWMARLGVAALVPLMLGGVYTHLFRGHPQMAVLPLVVLLLLAVVFWEHTESHWRRVLHHAAPARAGRLG